MDDERRKRVGKAPGIWALTFLLDCSILEAEKGREKRNTK